MNGFFALAIVTFWLTSFPLKGFFLLKEEYFLIFLLAHITGYTLIFLRYHFFEGNSFFPKFCFLPAFLTLLHPFLSTPTQIFLILLIGIISPLIMMRVVQILKAEGKTLWPYTGIILGNLFTYLLQIAGLSLWLKALILGFSLLILFFLKPSSESPQETEEAPLPLKDRIYLFSGIFSFYLIGPLIYEWIKKSSLDALHLPQLELIFYSLGILGALFYLKINIWSLKGLFISGAIFLSLAGAMFHFQTEPAFLVGKFFTSSAFGLMDLATLYFFINFFKTIRPIALLYAGISSSLFLGEYLLSLLLQNRDYYLASFQFFSLFSLLFFYKAYLKEQKTSSEKEILEGTFPEETEKPNILALPYKGALDPESLRDKLNSKVPPHAKRLTLRECEVLFYYVIEEKNLVEISTLLGLSRSSVREYLRRASFKLGTSPQEIRDFL